MILFGWGRAKRKSFGPVLKHLCNNCHTETDLHLYRVSLWVTLLFIPVYPYSTTMYLACPVCSFGMELNGDEVKRIRRASLRDRRVYGIYARKEPIQESIAQHGKLTV